MRNKRLTSGGVIPARVINIAVDTVYLYSQTTGTFSNIGVYMMDNNAVGGSTREGELELNSVVTAGFGIGFNVFPIDAAGSQGDIVQIVGFEVSSGTNIFGNFGYPVEQDAYSAYQWLGTAMIQGECVYQIKIGVSVGGAPLKYFWWSAHLKCIG